MFLRTRPRATCAIALTLTLLTAACSGDADPATIEREPITTGDDDADDPEPPPTTEPDQAPDEPDSDVDDPDPGDTNSLQWGPCDDIDDPAFDCAVLAVPLDHDTPEGDTIEIALARLPATGSRIGAVLVNPGGPGGSGIDFTVATGAYLAAEIGLEEFDLIGFDPRGVDRSGGLRCLTDSELDDLLFGGRTDDETEAFSGISGEEFAEACRDRYGDTLQHFSTLATARDMDLVREALGDDQLSYIGTSYGTYLGAVYATLFPDRVRAMVLDSGFEPTRDTLEERYLTQLVGFEEAFDAWAADCEANPECAFEARPVDEGWDALRDQLETDPLTGDDGRIVDASVFETATTSALYNPITWPLLSVALDDASAGDPAGLLQLADLYLGRNPDGTYDTIMQSNRIISCASGFGAAVPDDPEALAELIRQTAPRWGRDVDADSFTDGCTPLMDPVELPELGFTGDAPVLVIGGVNDPATPFRWSEELADTMGPSAALVTWNGEGHGMLVSSNCLLGHAHDVLVRLSTPASGEVCDPDPDVPRPDFWDDLPVPDGVSPEPLGPEAMNVLGLPSRLVYGEARTTTLAPDDLLSAYRTALTDQGFQSVAREEPIPGLIVETFLSRSFDALSIVVVADEAYDDPELAIAQRLVGEGETLFALITFG